MKTKTDAEVRNTRDDVEMMKRRHLWAYWPRTLPLKHCSERDQDGVPALAYLTDAFGDPNFRLRIGNIKRKDPNDPYIDYDSAEAIFAHGWRVD